MENNRKSSHSFPPHRNLVFPTFSFLYDIFLILEFLTYHFSSISLTCLPSQHTVPLRLPFLHDQTLPPRIYYEQIIISPAVTCTSKWTMFFFVFIVTSSSVNPPAGSTSYDILLEDKPCTIPSFSSTNSILLPQPHHEPSLNSSGCFITPTITSTTSQQRPFGK